MSPYRHAPPLLPPMVRSPRAPLRQRVIALIRRRRGLALGIGLYLDRPRAALLLLVLGAVVLTWCGADP